MAPDIALSSSSSSTPNSLDTMAMRPSQQALDGVVVRALDNFKAVAESFPGCRDIAKTFPSRLAHGGQAALGWALGTPVLGGIGLATGAMMVVVAGAAGAVALTRPDIISSGVDPLVPPSDAPVPVKCAMIVGAGAGCVALGGATLVMWPVSMATAATLGAAFGFFYPPEDW